jgi:peptidoglycan hydrolase CwlO-like protein
MDMVMNDPKIFLIIIVMIVASNIVSLLVFNTLSGIQIQNNAKPQSNFTGQAEAFEDIRKISGMVESLNNKVDELFLQKYANASSTNVFIP